MLEMCVFEFLFYSFCFHFVVSEFLESKSQSGFWGIDIGARSICLFRDDVISYKPHNTNDG